MSDVHVSTGNEFSWILNEIVREVTGGEIKDPNKPLIDELQCDLATARAIIKKFLCKDDAYCRLWKLQFGKSSRENEEYRECTLDTTGIEKFANFAMTKRRFVWTLDPNMTALELIRFRYRLSERCAQILRTLDNQVLAQYARKLVQTEM